MTVVQMNIIIMGKFGQYLKVVLCQLWSVPEFLRDVEVQIDINLKETE